MNELKVLLWNLQDFFMIMDKFQGADLSAISEAKWQQQHTSLRPNKELEKIIAIAQVIQKNDFDICLFTEVGGLESLNNFNTHFLDNSYTVYCEPSNSDRGIDLAILIRKDLNLNHQQTLHKPSVFARGIYELTLDGAGIPITFLLTHLKSKLTKNDDIEGRDQRTKEVEHLSKIFEERKNQGQLVFICGDLNARYKFTQQEPELAILAKKNRLIDVLELLNKTEFESATYLYYNEAKEIDLMQLDYFLTEEKWHEVVSSKSQVLDFDGEERKSLPSKFEDKLKQPSDHYPLLITLNLDKINNKG